MDRYASLLALGICFCASPVAAQDATQPASVTDGTTANPVRVIARVSARIVAGERIDFHATPRPDRYFRVDRQCWIVRKRRDTGQILILFE